MRSGFILSFSSLHPEEREIPSPFVTRLRRPQDEGISCITKDEGTITGVAFFMAPLLDEEYCEKQRLTIVTVWVYILKCADGSYYVGKYQGDDLSWRVSEHNEALYPNAYTAKRRPVVLMWSQWFSRYDDAAVLERRLKGWSRAKKEALIRNDETALKAYSKRGFRPAFALRDAAAQDEASAPLNEGEPARRRM